LVLKIVTRRVERKLKTGVPTVVPPLIRRNSQTQPLPNMASKSRFVRGSESADGFDDQPILYGCDLGFNAANNIQARLSPILEHKVHVWQYRRDEHDKEVPRVAAVSDDDRRANFPAREVRKRNRQENDLTS